ncbi:helix-turn-helix domain-containing protein [Rhizobiales bacterium RZME27]|uniref:Helix-turn-helix domain-containing protein n=1 Tax=Endobacterium cereale TaxID=2663029 RepID=A0A6A8AC71_9HYPH|nr:helix-turn-helix domain-containing protein [Endobacterium cereale]MEB2846353.1 helix-turn-helix domain-containing protein [Endobacterium cereale]MQY46351.1 helix-turn-helix domain-containing protein [Endobacterium cereale]
MSRVIPTFDLYGEDRAHEPDFRLHCETIASRSSAYHWEIDLHRHEHFMQFLYIWHGSGDAILDGRTTTLATPCVIFVPPGPVHGFRFSRDIAGLVITATTAQRPDTAGRDARVIPLETGSSDADYLHQTFHRIADEYDAARPGRTDILDAYLSIVTALIHRSDAVTKNSTVIDDAERHVMALNELIGRHFRQQMTVTEYAASLSLSPTHLNRTVRKVTGMTAHELIIGRTIDEAKRALALTGASIQHISENLGFSDATYFSRCFRQHTGMSPRDYRKNQRMQATNEL